MRLYGHIYLVGVGGFGLSAIARVLLQQGYVVSGSDANPNPRMAALAARGATIYERHDPANIAGVDVIIASSAIQPGTGGAVILDKARERGIPIYKRDEIIAELMQDKTVIAVAGTHGKTTTTAMIAHLLLENNQAPSYIVGGVMANTGTNAGAGDGSAFVIEADEYDNMFLGLEPNIIVLTSVEYDHPDFFQTHEQMLGSFRAFLQLLPEDASSLNSTLVACVDDPAVRMLLDEIKAARPNLNWITYGVQDETESLFHAANIRMEDGSTLFDLVMSRMRLGTARLHQPGLHNVQNALAALIVADGQGVPFTQAIDSLATFKSTGRRFEIRGEANGVIVIDDYAHHPTAIKTTLAAARSRYPDHTLWAVWQPHMHSRTQQLLDDYAAAFGDADHVLVLPVYSVREQPIPGVDAITIANALKCDDSHHVLSLADGVDFLAEEATGPAVVLVMSAGDAPQLSTRLVERL